MNCKYLYEDCTQNEDMCLLCIRGTKYIPPKKRQYGIKQNRNKLTNRMGANAEKIAQDKNKATIDSNMTPNSGAGNVKGDIQLKGLVNIMQEVKTQEVIRARGHSQFTIKKEWLDKLDLEAKKENMEFWHLIFSFKDTDKKQYCVIDMQQMQDMIATLIEDRKIAKLAESKIDIVNKKRALIEAENLTLLAKIDLLEAELSLANKKTM